MEAFYLDWANLLLRWLHVITAMAWIGASFYFVFLDSSLEKPQEPNPDRLSGELWAIHGGGFYHARKFIAAPLGSVGSCTGSILRAISRGSPAFFSSRFLTSGPLRSILLTLPSPT